MGRKYGKKSSVVIDPARYIIGLLGESGVGKTTLMCKVCDKLFGDGGYLIVDVGKEDGLACIEGYDYETVSTFKASKKQEDEGIVGFTNLVDEIVNNREDWKNLKVIVLDTVDQTFDMSEKYSILEWNVENKGVQNFKPAKTINGTWGGAGKNFTHVSDHVLNLIWKLRAVGVGVWYTGHVKQKQIDDAASGRSYSQLTTNMMNTYFNSIKTKTHILGIAYVDREIVEENTGKKNMFTKEEIKKNTITSETRKIKFRDDNYSLDSKSRFSDIVEEINLDVDEFIQAITDAIKVEMAKGNNSDDKLKVNIEDSVKKNVDDKSVSKEDANDTVIEAEEEMSESIADEISVEDDNIFAEEETSEEEINKEDKIVKIRNSIKGNAELRTKATNIMKANNVKSFNADIPDDVLDEIYSLI